MGEDEGQVEVVATGLLSGPKRVTNSIKGEGKQVPLYYDGRVVGVINHFELLPSGEIRMSGRMDHVVWRQTGVGKPKVVGFVELPSGVVVDEVRLGRAREGT